MMTSRCEVSTSCFFFFFDWCVTTLTSHFFRRIFQSTIEQSSKTLRKAAKPSSSQSQTMPAINGGMRLSSQFPRIRATRPLQPSINNLKLSFEKKAYSSALGARHLTKCTLQSDSTVLQLIPTRSSVACPRQLEPPST